MKNRYIMSEYELMELTAEVYNRRLSNLEENNRKRLEHKWKQGKGSRDTLFERAYNYISQRYPTYSIVFSTLYWCNFVVKETRTLF